MKQKRRVNEIIGIVFFLTAIFLQAVSVFLCFSSDIYDGLSTSSPVSGSTPLIAGTSVGAGI